MGHHADGRRRILAADFLHAHRFIQCAKGPSHCDQERRKGPEHCGEDGRAVDDVKVQVDELNGYRVVTADNDTHEASTGMSC